MNVPIIADRKCQERFLTETNTYTMLRAVPIEVDHFCNHANWVLSLFIASHHLAGAESAMPQLSLSLFPTASQRNPFEAFVTHESPSSNYITHSPFHGYQYG